MTILYLIIMAIKTISIGIRGMGSLLYGHRYVGEWFSSVGQLLDANNTDDKIWANSAYLTIAIVTVLEMMSFESRINERAYRNRSLSAEQIADNCNRSKMRAKIEHVLGSMVNEMEGKVVCTIG